MHSCVRGEETVDSLVFLWLRRPTIVKRGEAKRREKNIFHSIFERATMKRSSTSLKPMFRRAKRREDLWLDSDSDDEENRSVLRASSKENRLSVSGHCCLICSILNSLTEDNCCAKHLHLLERRHRRTSRHSSSFCSSLSSNTSKRQEKATQSRIEFLSHR